eukprot:TRINITY_DN16008_c0_g1_i1.p1 TRINITY_DN16008_c0_g1~~TRINITY_DN16008_c0_g1_i1.p1  ORF type:complete len:482 (-),score=71.23 TRINITY_DN16008_c0_g1_i1:34-1479(-)
MASYLRLAAALVALCPAGSFGSRVIARPKGATRREAVMFGRARPTSVPKNLTSGLLWLDQNGGDQGSRSDSSSSSSSEEAAEPRPQVCLLDMHSFIRLPSCQQDRGARAYAHRLAISAKQSRESSNNDIERVTSDYSCFLSGETPKLKYIDIHWNVPGAFHSLQLEGARGRCEDTRQAGFDGHALKLLEDVRMHPICGWEVLKDLQSVYNTHFRHSLEDAPISSVLSGIHLALSGRMMHKMRQVGQFAKNLAGRRWKTMLGDVATGIDWDQFGKCTMKVSRENVLRRDGKGKVCWNMVKDFYDLYCLLIEEAEALESGSCDIQEANCCMAIAESRQKERNQIYRLLLHRVRDTWRNLMTGKNNSARLEVLKELALLVDEEMPALGFAASEQANLTWRDGTGALKQAELALRNPDYLNELLGFEYNAFEDWDGSRTLTGILPGMMRPGRHRVGEATIERQFSKKAFQGRQKRRAATKINRLG